MAALKGLQWKTLAALSLFLESLEIYGPFFFLLPHRAGTTVYVAYLFNVVFNVFLRIYIPLEALKSQNVFLHVYKRAPPIYYGGLLSSFNVLPKIYHIEFS